PIPEWVEGTPLPTAPGSDRQRVITEWDSQFREIGMHLRTIYRDGFICTVYEPTTRDYGVSLEKLLKTFGSRQSPPDIRYDGSEGELYDVNAAPHQWRNLWNDPGYAKLRADLVADLYDNLPKSRDPLLPVDTFA